MKAFILRFVLLSVFAIASIGMACAQANHTLNFRLGGVVYGGAETVTATISQPYSAVLSTSAGGEKTASMDALFITANYEAIVNIQFQTHSSGTYIARITIGNTWSEDIKFSGTGNYYGPLPLDKTQNETDILITIYKSR